MERSSCGPALVYSYRSKAGRSGAPNGVARCRPTTQDSKHNGQAARAQPLPDGVADAQRGGSRLSDRTRDENEGQRDEFVRRTPKHYNLTIWRSFRVGGLIPFWIDKIRDSRKLNKGSFNRDIDISLGRAPGCRIPGLAPRCERLSTLNHLSSIGVKPRVSRDPGRKACSASLHQSNGDTGRRCAGCLRSEFWASVSETKGGPCTIQLPPCPSTRVHCWPPNRVAQHAVVLRGRVFL